MGIRSLEMPCIDLSTRAARPRRSDLATDHLALPLWSIQALGENQHVPMVLLVLDVVDLGPCLDRNAARRCAPPCRTASAAARAAQSNPEPRLSPRKITHDALIMPDLEPGRFDPRSIGFDGIPVNLSHAAVGFGRRCYRAAAPHAQLTRAVRSEIRA
jgi:hypothetical protein